MIIKERPEDVDDIMFPIDIGGWSEKDKKYADKLTPDKTYYVRTSEYGEEVEFTAKFLGWEKRNIEEFPCKDNTWYVAVFKPIGNINMETISGSSITEVD